MIPWNVFVPCLVCYVGGFVMGAIIATYLTYLQNKRDNEKQRN